MKRKSNDRLKGYKPLAWTKDSQLSKHEQDIVEHQRQDLYEHGIKEPQLTRMAFEFGAVIVMMQSTPKSG